jgi:transcriptional regulator
MCSRNKLPVSVKEIKNINANNPDGMSHRKIAEILHMTRGEVWHLENRALGKIRKFILDNNLSPVLLEYFTD